MFQSQEAVEPYQIVWDRERVAPNAAELAARLARGARASLMMPGPTSPELRVVAASGVPLGSIASARVRLGEPVAGLVAQTRRPLLVNGGTLFAELAGRRPAQYGSTSFICAPVPLDEGGYGVLSVADPIGRERFQNDDLDALEALARLIGRELVAERLRTRLARAEENAADLRRELIWVQEAERNRLARDLHDEAGHALTLALFQVDLQRVRADLPPDVKESLVQARDMILDCATALNDMAFRLRPRILDDLGLVPALRTLIAQGPEGLRVELQISGDERPLGGEVELVAFRVIQEALTNVRKHARAGRAWVQLAFAPDALHIVVQDNGIGVERREALAGEHTSQGLRGMQERVGALGGTFAIGPRPLRGTCLEVRLPLHSREARHDDE
jgi:signal transduction histidine kinase